MTRSELREEIGRLDDRIDRLDQKVEQGFAQMAAQMATKADLAQLAAETKADIARLESQMATKTDLALWGGALLERLLTELARHTRASQEALSAQISVLDDKYADLPARMTRLEAVVFRPRRR